MSRGPDDVLAVCETRGMEQQLTHDGSYSSPVWEFGSQSTRYSRRSGVLLRSSMISLIANQSSRLAGDAGEWLGLRRRLDMKARRGPETRRRKAVDRQAMGCEAAMQTNELLFAGWVNVNVAARLGVGLNGSAPRCTTSTSRAALGRTGTLDPWRISLNCICRLGVLF